MIIELDLNSYYRVTHRTWDNKRIVTAKRKYFGTERRFGSILCYIFSSRVTKKGYSSELSIPHYDLKEAREV